MCILLEGDLRVVCSDGEVSCSLILVAAASRGQLNIYTPRKLELFNTLCMQPKSFSAYSVCVKYRIVTLEDLFSFFFFFFSLFMKENYLIV